MWYGYYVIPKSYVIQSMLWIKVQFYGSTKTNYFIASKTGLAFRMSPDILNPEYYPNNPFGWVTVSGSIDDYILDHYKLMPMGNGKLFLPVKAAIRKKIKKEAGDTVRIKLQVDHSPITIPDEIKECFLQESKKTYENFEKLPQSEQKAFIDFVILGC